VLPPNCFAQSSALVAALTQVADIMQYYPPLPHQQRWHQAHPAKHHEGARHAVLRHHNGVQNTCAASKTRCETAGHAVLRDMLYCVTTVVSRIPVQSHPMERCADYVRMHVGTNRAGSSLQLTDWKAMQLYRACGVQFALERSICIPASLLNYLSSKCLCVLSDCCKPV
jgi:hypothetical protein